MFCGELKRLALIITLLFPWALSGCGEGTQNTAKNPDISSTPAIELVGEWETSSGEQAFITENMWGLDTIWAFDNDANYVITQTASNASSGANSYNKIVWTDVVNNSFYACYVLFGYETIEEIETAEYDLNDSDPETGGCNNFPWFLFVRESPTQRTPADPGNFMDAN